MKQTNGIVNPSGTIISNNAEVDRILGLGKRTKEEAKRATAAQDKEAEDLVTAPTPTCKRRSTRRASPPNKRLCVSSALVNFEDEDTSPILLSARTPMAKSSATVPASVLQAPSEELSGVSLSLTEVCATISKQIYDATSMESCNLSGSNNHAEVLYKKKDFPDHGFLNLSDEIALLMEIF
jgi:hypothetical protein